MNETGTTIAPSTVLSSTTSTEINIPKLCRNKKRSNKHFEFGRSYGHLLAHILPEIVCPIAATTCRFKITSVCCQDSGKWTAKKVTTYIQTHGNLFKTEETFTSKVKGEWLEINSIAAAEIILECFGIDLQAINDYYGPFAGSTSLAPVLKQRYVVDLKDVVEKLTNFKWETQGKAEKKEDRADIVVDEDIQKAFNEANSNAFEEIDSPYPESCGCCNDPIEDDSIPYSDMHSNVEQLIRGEDGD